MTSPFTHFGRGNASLYKKLKTLSFHLCTLHRQLVCAAGFTEDQAMTGVIRDLATFAQQAYNELVSVIQVIERKPYTKEAVDVALPRETLRYLKWEKALPTANRPAALMEYCFLVETNIIEAYRLFFRKYADVCGSSLRPLLESQLNGFLYGLARLKLMDACK